MSSTTFDTHYFVKKLVSSGMSEAQAEAVVDAVKTAQSDKDARMVTKNELALFKSEMSHDFQALDNKIDAVEQRLKAEINLLKFGIGYIIAAITGLGIKEIFFG